MLAGFFDGQFLEEASTTGDMADMRCFKFKLGAYVEEVGQYYPFDKITKPNYTHYVPKDSSELEVLSTLKPGAVYSFLCGTSFKQGFGGKPGKLRMIFLKANAREQRQAA